MKENDFLCPICGAGLAQMVGDIMYKGNPDYGVTVWCPNQDCKSKEGIPCQEVMGHGTNAKNAFDIIQERFRVKL